MAMRQRSIMVERSLLAYSCIRRRAAASWSAIF